MSTEFELDINESVESAEVEQSTAPETEGASGTAEPTADAMAEAEAIAENKEEADVEEEAEPVPVLKCTNLTKQSSGLASIDTRQLTIQENISIQ